MDIETLQLAFFHQAALKLSSINIHNTSSIVTSIVAQLVCHETTGLRQILVRKKLRVQILSNIKIIGVVVLSIMINTGPVRAAHHKMT